MFLNYFVILLAYRNIKANGGSYTAGTDTTTKGYIGLQGKHGESNIWFRNIQLKQL